MEDRIRNALAKGRQILAAADWAAYRVRRSLAGRLGPALRSLKAPPLPCNADGRVLLHLGCGEVDAPGFVNVDIRPASHVHYVADLRDLSFLADESADLAYACHVLEHFPAPHDKVLWEWRRVLKRGGILRVSVPCFDALIAVYQACSRDVEAVVGPLFGDHSFGYPGHLHAFNFAYLEKVMKRVGFTDVRRWDPHSAPDYPFDDWASRTILRQNTPFHVSLNVEGVR